MSAAWGPKWLDSQHSFIFGMSKNGSKDIGWWDDYGRAAKLCSWAKSRDIEGFVRMNAGLWVLFSSTAGHRNSLTLVAKLYGATSHRRRLPQSRT
jgi:hypothetical protein